MATEPHAAPSTASTWSHPSPIENELPTYRAISTWSVLALVLGLVSAFAFASLTFVIASVGAIASGAMAQRMIRRYPDLLTGSGLANLGIALGLITGLAAPTLYTVQRTIIGRDAQGYANQVAVAFQEQGLADAFWLAQHPSIRSETNPQKLMAEIEASSETEQMGPDERLSAFRSIGQRLEDSDAQHIHVDDVEARGFDGITPYAYVRLMLDGPETDQFPAVQYVLLRVEGVDHEGQRQWHVKDVVFPYEAETQSSVVASAHGHDH